MQYNKNVSAQSILADTFLSLLVKEALSGKEKFNPRPRCPVWLRQCL